MTHAILILAHRDIVLLHKLIQYFDSNCFVFLHIDKCSTFTNDEILSLKNFKQVVSIYREFCVHWGGFSMLQTELVLLERALLECKADYFHLISGQDYPIKKLNVFMDFFKVNNGKSFVEYNIIPVHLWSIHDQWRYRYFLPFDLMETERLNTNKLSKWIKQQQECSFMRSLPTQFTNIYKGSQWFSITRSDAQLIIDYTHRFPSFCTKLKYSFAPEETYIVTLLVNKSTSILINNNLRYIRWYGEHGNNPSNLAIEHYDDIARSNAFFCRKIDLNISQSLIDLLDNILYGED